MSISIYSVLTSFLWFNLFIIILCFLRRKLGIILGYSLLPLTILLVLSIVRLLFPFELPFAIVLRSEQMLPIIQKILRTRVFSAGTTNITLTIMVVSILSLVSVVLFVRLLLLVHRKLRSFKSRVQTDDTRLLSIFEQIKNESPSRRKCHLYVSKNCSGPYIFGFMYSGIMLPQDILSLSDQDLYYVLKHEWQHHLENDVSVKFFIEGLCCILWWNPFVFLLRHNLNQTLELKCDKRVTKDLNLEQRINYTESLLHVLTLCTMDEPMSPKEGVASIPFLGMATKHKSSADENTLQRFDAILESDIQNKKVAITCGTCLLFLFLFSFCFVIQPYSLPSEEDFWPDTKDEVAVSLLQITPESSLLVDNQDGTYSLFVDGEYWRDISNQEIKYDPYQSLPVIAPE